MSDNLASLKTSLRGQADYQCISLGRYAAEIVAFDERGYDHEPAAKALILNLKIRT